VATHQPVGSSEHINEPRETTPATDIDLGSQRTAQQTDEMTMARHSVTPVLVRDVYADS
jgi:hypothetical protein